MGQKASTGAYSGFLEGVSVPPPPGVHLPAPPSRPVKVTIPQPKKKEDRPLKPGDTFPVELCNGQKCVVRVPQGARPGQQVPMSIPEHHKMVASTLHAPPVGFKVLAQKPIVVANISYQIQGPTKEQASSQQVASLMQAAQNELLRQAHAAGCNAVLGIGFSVTTTSSGLSTPASTLAMVSAFGTPCTIGKDAYPMPVMPADPNAGAPAAAAGMVPGLHEIHQVGPNGEAGPAAAIPSGLGQDKTQQDIGDDEFLDAEAELVMGTEVPEDSPAGDDSPCLNGEPSASS